MATTYETITERLLVKVERYPNGTFRTYELDGKAVLREDRGYEWFNHDKGVTYIDCRLSGSYDRSVTKDEFVELLSELTRESGEPLPTNDVYVMHENGETELLASYDGNLSADYALYLYWAQQLTKCDYLNNANRRRYNGQRTISKTMRSTMFEVGNDVFICSATKHNCRSAVVGRSVSEFDYEPNYPKAA